MKADKPLLSVRGLSVGYPQGRSYMTPVDQVSFQIEKGEILGLIGDAGSGKSTLALALLGLARAPGKILAGEIEFGGRDLLSLLEDELRRIRGNEISIIVQNPRSSLNPLLRVGKQIGNAFLAHNGGNRNEADRKAVDLLRMVGINDPERRAQAFAHELSGGMAQRALIAMALSSKPQLLIADEPTSGLDVTIQAQFLDEMWANVKASGSAMLYVTQDLGGIANYCDRVLVQHGGKIVEDRPVREFFADPHHPYSQEVLRLYRERSGEYPAQVPEDTPILLQAKGMGKKFPIRDQKKFVHAVDNFTLSVRRGEAIGLVGESGSGKTTAGRCLVRLIDSTSGEILFDGKDLAKVAADQMRAYRARMQIVFQDPFDSLNPRWTIREILEEPLKLHGGKDAAARLSRVKEVLAMVGLPEALLKRKSRGIGAGALQRVNIARAIICEPEFIVLDEPTSVLAPRARTALVELLAKLQPVLGIAFIFISHDLTTVRYLCQRVAVMYLGQIVEEGTVQEVFTDPKHPYSRALLAAALFPDPERRRVDNPVPAALQGEIPSPIDLPKGCYLASRCPMVQESCRQIPQVLQEIGPRRAVRCHLALQSEGISA